MVLYHIFCSGKVEGVGYVYNGDMLLVLIGMCMLCNV